MNKNVLSLGAGKEQIPSILLAKKKRIPCNWY
jgi:hypothetical protein